MARKRRKPAVEQYERPTAERERHTEFRSAGVARVTVPPIERLYEAGKLSQGQFEVLAYYGEQARIADRSLTRSCCDFTPRGDGHGPTAAVLSAMLETARMEKLLGNLRHIARWVARDDRSLAQWCIHKHGGRERLNGEGKVIAIVPKREKTVMDEAHRELRQAAKIICG